MCRVGSTGAHSSAGQCCNRQGHARCAQVIKGNWQLSGGHKGDRGDDRTAGKQAIADFKAFVDAGVTTFDTADIYGPSESLIGDYINSRGGAEGLQLLTKACKFGSDMQNVSQDSISAVRPLSGCTSLMHPAPTPVAGSHSSRHELRRRFLHTALERISNNPCSPQAWL